jgi:YYY domain-containing protein
MLAAFWWVLGTTLIGWLCLPLTQKICRNLPGKGYAFSRALGLLLWGFFHWFLVSIGILKNTLTWQIIVLLALTVVSAGILYKSGIRDFAKWLRLNWRLVLAVELVFWVSFAVFAVFRSTSPGITGTEKPMELAFLNGILRSETFPPQDPWLSGYAISYYYFGYLMVAMLTRLTGVSSAVAYNLAQALWFALIAVGAYGLLAELLATRKRLGKMGLHHHLRYALLAPVMLLLVSNTYGFLDSLHARGLLNGQVVIDGGQSGFWSWIGQKGLTGPPDQPLTYIPQAHGVATWWQASRVIYDVNYSGEAKEIISEFPNFSFVLGDLHPHLLALPFALLSIGLAFNFLLSPHEETHLAGRWRLPFKPGWFVLDAGLIASLAFLNTWDWPFYAALYAAVFLVRRVRAVGWKALRMVEFVAFGLGMAAIGVICYLPFFLNFASQAGGVLPSVIYSTRGVDFWIMFAPLLIPVFGFLVMKSRRLGKGKHFSTAVLITGLTLIVLAVFSALLAVVASDLGELGDLFMWNLGASGTSIGEVLWEALQRRLAAPGTWLTLGSMMTLCLAVLIKSGKQETESDHHPANPTDGFILLLILWGVLLTLIPEFIYLLDGFGTRMNTIFKFYFQAWLLWSIVGAYGIAALWQNRSTRLENQDRGWLAVLITLSIGIVLVTAMEPMAAVSAAAHTRFGVYLLDWLWAAYGIGIVLGMIWMGFRRRWGGMVQILVVMGLTTGLIYPALAIPDRADGFRFAEDWTLDGSAVYRQSEPDLMAAVEWLQTAEPGVLAEAVGTNGGDYSSYGRVSMLTGFQAVLGWRYHEEQWRGGSEEIGSRQEDLEILYETGDWDAAKGVIDMYNIRYIYLGNLERTTYDMETEKFDQQLTVAFEQGTVTIYQVNSK